MARTFAPALAALFLLTATTGPAAAEEKYTLKIATVAPEGTPWAELLKLYQKRVKKESHGRIKVKV